MGQGERSEDLGSCSTLHLLNEAQAGSEKAREVLVARYLPWLEKWALGRLPVSTRESLSADKVARNMVVEAVRHLEGFDPAKGVAFRGYLRRTTRHWIGDEINRIRHSSVEGRSEAGASQGPSLLEAAIGKDRVASYEAALERLEPSDQEAIVARLEDGASYSAIGQELGIDEDAARETVKRALCRLAREMAKARR